MISDYHDEEIDWPPKPAPKPKKKKEPSCAPRRSAAEEGQEDDCSPEFPSAHDASRWVSCETSPKNYRSGCGAWATPCPTPTARASSAAGVSRGGLVDGVRRRRLTDAPADEAWRRSGASQETIECGRESAPRCRRLQGAVVLRVQEGRDNIGGCSASVRGRRRSRRTRRRSRRARRPRNWRASGNLPRTRSRATSLRQGGPRGRRPKGRLGRPF